MIHTCHWPGCNTPVPPRMWGCAPHWHALPASIRLKIRTYYRPGQEIDKRPSRLYLIAVLEASQWIDRHGGWVQVIHEMPNFNVYGFHLKDGNEPRTVKVRMSDGKQMHVPYQGWGIFGYGGNDAILEFTRSVTHWQRNLWWENSSKGNAGAHDPAKKEKHMEGENQQQEQGGNTEPTQDGGAEQTQAETGTGGSEAGQQDTTTGGESQQ